MREPSTGRPGRWSSAKTIASRAGSIAIAAIVTAAPAYAQLTVCNTTTSRIGVALGYQDQTGWTSEGWWNIASQSCETVLKSSIPSRFLYVHAVDYDRGGDWSGSNKLCTADKSFAIREADKCAKAGSVAAGFFEVDTGDAKEWTIRIADPDDQGGKVR